MGELVNISGKDDRKAESGAGSVSRSRALSVIVQYIYGLLIFKGLIIVTLSSLSVYFLDYP